MTKQTRGFISATIITYQAACQPGQCSWIKRATVSYLFFFAVSIVVRSKKGFFSGPFATTKMSFTTRPSAPGISYVYFRGKGKRDEGPADSEERIVIILSSNGGDNKRFSLIATSLFYRVQFSSSHAGGISCLRMFCNPECLYCTLSCCRGISQSQGQRHICLLIAALRESA